jgi:hypothetical protein
MALKDWLVIGAAGLALSLGVVGYTATTRAEEADAPMDHAALASSYQAEAKDALQKAAMHQTMLNRYKNAPTLPKGTAVPKQAMVQHCQKLVDSYTQAASQASDLAKLHQDAASQEAH